MTNQKPWLRYTTNHDVHIVGEFENELGERFIIYRNGKPYPGLPTGDTVYVTGDEFSWEPKVRLLWGGFFFSEEERDKIAKILWPIPSDTPENMAMITAARAYMDQHGLDYAQPSGEKETGTP